MDHKETGYECINWTDVAKVSMVMNLQVLKNAGICCPAE